MDPSADAAGESSSPPPELDAETRPLRAIFRSDEAASPYSPAETVILRRLAASPSSPGSPSDDAEIAALSEPRDSVGAPGTEPLPSTPVPPPVPVLPEPPGLPASAGRRFSASSEPLESAWAAPRRSATSVTSPPSPEEPEATPPEAELTETPAAPDERPRGRRRPVIVIAAVAVVALIVGGVVWATNLTGTSTTGNPSSSASATVPDPLLTSADLTALGASGWTVDTASTSPTDESPRPICLPATGEGLAETQSSAMRRLTSTSSPTMSAIHYIDTYADEAAAAEAYAQRVMQTGTCPDTQVLITNGYRVTGLADEATSSTLVVQANPAEYHTLQVSLTGRTLNLIDILSSEEATAAQDVASASASALTRQCTPGEGTCPGTPKAAKDVPAAGDLPGWLVEADLPRVNPGAGRWGATDPSATLTVVGSQCEGIDLVNVTGTSNKGQRTFLLADDPAAPMGFGVDQVTYSFADEADAAALAKKLTTNIANCAKRAPTAKVSSGPAIKGTGADSVKITGSTYEVSQKTEGSSTVSYRIAVATLGNHVSYLLANPSQDFDFTDNAWTALGLRAAQRTSQTA